MAERALTSRKDGRRASAAAVPAPTGIVVPLPHRARLPLVPPPLKPWRRPLRAAWLSLAAERVGLRLWPLPGLLMLGLALAWSGALPHLPPWAHGLALAAFAAAFIALLVRRLRGLRLPDRDAVFRRLERDNTLRHRPFDLLIDTPVNQGGGAQGGVDQTSPAATLWAAAQDRARRALAGVRAGWPALDLPNRDPWALRHIAVLLLAIAAVMAWGDWRPRLIEALDPGFEAPPAGAEADLDVWITPPESTGLPPQFLTRRGKAGPAEGGGAVSVPAGATVTARLGPHHRAPELSLDEDALALDPAATGGFQASRTVTKGRRITVTDRGRTLGSWPIRIVADDPPAIAFREKPSATERYALRLDYTAADDYGIASVTATVTPTTRAEGTTVEPLVLTLPVPARPSREASAAGTPVVANASGYFDLTASPWAGQPVTIQLTATDTAGQRATSDTQTITLPERVFNNPTAKAVIAQRRALLDQGEEARKPAANALLGLAGELDGYAGDPTVFMALYAAARHLGLNDDGRSLTDVADLLWDTALKIEDGSLASAETELRDARQRLADALDRNAPEAEIRRDLDALKSALNRYMQALAEKSDQQQGQNGAPPPDDQNAQTIDMGQMMEQLEQMAQTGARDAARKMLDQMQDLMESVQTGPRKPPTEAEQQQMRQNLQMLEKLQDLAKRQRELMDQTFRQGDRGEPEDSPPQPSTRGDGPNRSAPNRQGAAPRQPQRDPSAEATARDLAKQQDALRRELQALMQQQGQQAGQQSDEGQPDGQQGQDQPGGQQNGNGGGNGPGQAPSPLDKADRAMGQAGRALSEGSPEDAVEAQGRALEALQDGLKGMAQQMARQMGRGTRVAPRNATNGRGQNTDPLGRQMTGQGATSTDSVKIPDHGDLQRAREILEELRRRASEAGRPKEELDYIDRLLKRF
ncbi:TIGR02302 family protein [Nitrospirillum amazonense]|uniref:TIGR02302 family protein n=1 Tax=Nitrospirillum amazonense TaxID=28077 RepID=UPI0024121AB8|nr:TIGR02302 family protein [Nitrospirillum amazonense]MDG3440753.1 TIGR02302 family protein [Nitrospirillum amazonense]